MQANHTMPTSTVYRSRFLSATEEPARLEVTPPPNMLDMPPPLPRCSRISMVSRMLVMISNTINVYANAIGMVGSFLSKGTASATTIAGARPPVGDRAHNSACGVLREPADRRELLGVEAGPADERTVDVR